MKKFTFINLLGRKVYLKFSRVELFAVVFWMVPYILLGGYERFGGNSSLIIYPDDGISMFHLNVSNHPSDYTV
jgi:hypothetical protein